MLPFVFDNSFGFEQYVDYALDVPMYFVYRNKKYIDCTGMSFRDFMQGMLPQAPGELPTLNDWENHLTTIFPEVRLKRYLEMRGADGGPWRRLCALPAFWCSHKWKFLEKYIMMDAYKTRGNCSGCHKRKHIIGTFSFYDRGFNCSAWKETQTGNPVYGCGCSTYLNGQHPLVIHAGPTFACTASILYSVWGPSVNPTVPGKLACLSFDRKFMPTDHVLLGSNHALYFCYFICSSVFSTSLISLCKCNVPVS